jgi:hypothetical protein
MRYIRIILVTLVFITVLCSCNDKLNVNANWKDITVVYGLLSQNDDTAYIKITKAFLGNGDALQFAKIPDSSTYPNKLDVKLEAWSGNNLVKTYVFDTITIHTKEAGDSIFYFPTQMVYYCITGHLDQNNTYRLKITHKNTGVVDSAYTALVHSFNVDTPDPYIKMVDYIPGQYFDVKFDQAYGGKRYQLVVRFHYLETTGSGSKSKSLEWLVYNDYEVSNPYEVSSQPIEQSFSSDVFYTNVKANIKTLKEDPSVSSRTALYVDYIFSVASDDLSTYMNATEPSLSIIQERPSFSNIYNGIGLFSSRYVNEIDTIQLGNNTYNEFKTDTAFINRGF